MEHREVDLAGDDLAGLHVRAAGRAREPIVSTHILKGNREATVTKNSITIMDVDKETITTIDTDKKEYSVMTFAQMKQRMEDAMRQLQNRKDVQANFKISAKATGNTKTVQGLTAKQAIITMTTEVADAKSGQGGAMDMVSEVWAAPVPGYEELREFHKKLGAKMGNMFGSGMQQMAQMGGQGNMQQSMEELAKEMQKLDGVPVEQFISMGAEGQPGAAHDPDLQDYAVGQQPAFHTSDRCLACHNGLTSPSGKDVSIGFDWRTSMMANSGRDPYWQAGVRRETLDHPTAKAAIQDECMACHAPIARTHARLQGKEPDLLSHTPLRATDPAVREHADGVSCSVCHQISPANFGQPDSFNGGYIITPPKADGTYTEFGPYAIDPALQQVMRTSTSGFVPQQADHVRDLVSQMNAAKSAVAQQQFAVAIRDQLRAITFLMQEIRDQQNRD